MPNASWPSTLPQRPEPQTYRRQPKSPVISTKPEVGPDRRRRRASVLIHQHTITGLVDMEERQTLENFYWNTLNGGTLPYDHFDYGADTEPAATFQFISDPEFVPVGKVQWRFSIQVEDMP